ncbi:hypothetical protein HPB52_014888 [Rhipicephalus sanguineus]|uniref:Uncharacterized protein n=2 Tax=Rhipicephalus sanguineus TaxID=34632 RepID=A0A9D4PPA1_RHISA|nr:hypothetical protein HPB52_014888 [Rhipicephalus sanguineus]
MAAAAKPNKDYSLNIDDAYASPATMEKYMNSYSFPGPVDYMSAAAMSPDGGAIDFYPTMTSGSVFDNFAFSPTIKLDELAAYQEPRGHMFKESSRDKGKKVWRLKGVADDDDDAVFDEEGTRPSTTKNGGKHEEWRRPDSKRNSEESRSVEEQGAAAAPGRRRRPNGNSGSYFRGVPEQDEDSSEEEGGDDAPREDERAGTSPATSLSGRDEIAYSRGNSRRPFVRVKNSGALTSEEVSSSEEGQRAAAMPLRNYDTGPRGNGDVRGSTTTANQRFENGRRRNVGNGGYGNSGELPSFVAETSGSRAEGAARVRGAANGNDNDDVRDVRYNSYNGNNIDDSALRTASGAMLRDNLAATLTTTTTTSTTARPDIENGLILLNGNGRLAAAPQQPERSAKSRRRPPLAYTPGSMEYQSENDDEESSSRDQEETTTNGYSTTTTPEPFSYSSEEEAAPPRQESRFSAEERIHAMKRPTQTAAARMRRPVTGELGAAAATTPLTNGRSSATANAQRNVNNGRKRGGYAAPAQMPAQMPAQPPALPPASSLVFLSRDPTPSADQKAAATATTGADQRPAATTGAGGRPRTLFHQQGFQGPYSYRFGFDTADPYNPQTRYEEKDADGRVRGSYSYLDPKGRLQVVRYEADQQGGFRVKGSFGQFPGDTKP